MNQTIKANEIWSAEKKIDCSADGSYRLIKIDAMGEVYLLCINSSDERVALVAGYDEKEACSFARLLAKEEVTPCTANNIYADMLNK